MKEFSSIDSRLSNLHQMVMLGAVNRLKKAGHQRMEQGRDKVFGKLEPRKGEDEEMLVGGDLTVNFPDQSAAQPQKEKGFVAKALPIVATAALTAAGMWWVPVAAEFLRDRETHQAGVDTDTLIVPQIGWGPERD
jgi:hypothetical protein